MNNLFFKDIRGNFWAVNKVVGFIKDEQPIDDKIETHYLAVIEGGMSTEISQMLFAEMTSSLITLEAIDKKDEEDK